MQISRHAGSERTLKRWVATTLAKATGLIAEGLSVRAQAIMPGPRSDQRADQRSAPRSST